MPQTYFAILTAVGEAKDANAKALGIPLVFTEMAVGDGNGNLPVPDRTRVALVNEVRRAPLNQLSRDPVNTNQVIAEQVIPENVGGWWIREMGLYDEDGDLIAIANCPPTYKPQLVEGSGRTQIVRMILIMSSADAVQLKIDPAVVLATRKYADDAITASMNAHLSAGDPHPQYLTSAEGDAKIAAAVAALVNASPATLDTLAELATALGNDANFAATIANALTLKAPINSPAFTGNPSGPTATKFNNSQALVTTAFLKERGEEYSRVVEVAEAAKTLTIDSFGALTYIAGGAAQAITMPDVDGIETGAKVKIFCGNFAGCTVTPNVGQTLIANGASVPSVSLRIGEAVEATWWGDYWYLEGTGTLGKSGGFGSSLAVNGYQKLPSGLIIQFGYTAVSTSGTVVTLPIAFPNGVFSVVATPTNTNVPSGTLYAYFDGWTKIVIDFSDTSTGNAFWIALGY